MKYQLDESDLRRLLEMQDTVWELARKYSGIPAAKRLEELAFQFHEAVRDELAIVAKAYLQVKP